MRGLWLLLRAAIAVLLMLLFGVLVVITISSLVLLGVFAFWATTDGNSDFALGVVGCGCFAVAGVVLWSIVPRRDKFVPPGPELFEADHPTLFAELHEVAKRTAQAMPRHVYAIWEVNAFVMQRGGVMGVGSKRVMGLGLPLMRALDVRELRAVVAHELGHFHGGDVTLGPWIYRTRAAVLRTLSNLATGRDTMGLFGRGLFAVIRHIFEAVLATFRWFMRGFMRVTQAISRAQELSADRLAARIEGAAAVISGLKKTESARIALRLFMREEVVPLLDRGVLPPVGAGFSRFINRKPIAAVLDAVTQGQLRNTTNDAFDSHPSLAQRVAALEPISSPEAAVDARPAISLLARAEDLEHQLIEAAVERKLECITWEDVPGHWEQRWRRELQENRPVLAGNTIASIPTELSSLYELASHIDGRHAADLEDDDVVGIMQHTFGTAICVVLIDAGFRLSAEIGEPVRCQREDLVVEPFVEVGKYLRGETSLEAWRALWETHGVADKTLVPPAASDPS